MQVFKASQAGSWVYRSRHQRHRPADHYLLMSAISLEAKEGQQSPPFEKRTQVSNCSQITMSLSARVHKNYNRWGSRKHGDKQEPPIYCRKSFWKIFWLESISSKEPIMPVSCLEMNDLAELWCGNCKQPHMNTHKQPRHGNLPRPLTHTEGLKKTLGMCTCTQSYHLSEYTVDKSPT